MPVASATKRASTTSDGAGREAGSFLSPAGRPALVRPTGDALWWDRAGARATRKAREWRTQIWWTIFLAAIAYLVVFPLFQLQRFAFVNHAQGLKDALALPGIGAIVGTTLALGIGASLIAVVLGVVLALAVSRLPPRLSWMSLIPLVPMLVPMVAAVLGWMFLLSPTVGYINTLLRSTPLFDNQTSGPINIYSTPWIIVITGFILTSYVYLFVHSSLRRMGSNFEVAAASCGASQRRILWTVTIPMLRPAITYSTGVVLLHSMGTFTAPLILGRQENIQVITTELVKQAQAFPINYGLGAGLGTPLIVLSLVVVLLQRLSVRDSRRFVTASGRVEELSVRSSRLAPFGIAIYGVFAALLPVLSLIYMSFSRYWSGTVSLNNLSTASWSAVLHADQLWQALGTTAWATGLATLIVLPLGFLAARALSGFADIRRWQQTLIDVVSMAPLAVPAALLGYAFLFTYTRPPLVLYGSPWIFMVVYVTIALPLSTRMQLTALTSLGAETYEASRACGAGMARTLWKVVFPQVRVGISSAAAIIFVMLCHEFSASVMVRATNSQTLGVALYNALNYGVYPDMAAIALIMVVIEFAGVFTALALGGADVFKRQ